MIFLGTMTMLEKLTEWYDEVEKMGNGGHAIGFFRDQDEIVEGTYEFQKGKFTIKHVNGDFFCWGYEPKNNSDGAKV